MDLLAVQGALKRLLQHHKMIKTIPKKNKCKKAKWLSEEALQIAEKREAKGKEKKERYTHLNAELELDMEQQTGFK